MVLYFSNTLSSSILKGINFLFLTLNVLTYPINLYDIKINGLITSSKNPIKSLELLFVLINFEISILSTLTSQVFIAFIT